MGQIKCDEWNSNIKFHGSLFPNLSQGHSKCTIEKLHSNAIFRLIFIESIHRLWPNCMNHVLLFITEIKSDKTNQQRKYNGKKEKKFNKHNASDTANQNCFSLLWHILRKLDASHTTTHMMMAWVIKLFIQ